MKAKAPSNRNIGPAFCQVRLIGSYLIQNDGMIADENRAQFGRANKTSTGFLSRS